MNELEFNKKFNKHLKVTAILIVLYLLIAFTAIYFMIEGTTQLINKECDGSVAKCIGKSINSIKQEIK